MREPKRSLGIAIAATVLALAGTAQAQSDSPASAPGTPEAPPQVDCRPRYPDAALRAQAQGVTTLAFHVDATGQLTEVDIVRSSGRTREHRMLDSAAATALARCPFQAQMDADGHPVATILTVNYTWVIR